MSELIGTDKPLSPAAAATLRALAGTIIPASTAYDAPGADDEQIFADILRTAGPALAFIDESMNALNGIAGRTAYAELRDAEQLHLAEQFRLSHPDAIGLVISLICQCYYRDQRVLASLGMAPRPPFPEGFDVPDGDWSLLEPVRARGIAYRQVP